MLDISQVCMDTRGVLCFVPLSCCTVNYDMHKGVHLFTVATALPSRLNRSMCVCRASTCESSNTSNTHAERSLGSELQGPLGDNEPFTLQYLVPFISQHTSHCCSVLLLKKFNTSFTCFTLKPFQRLRTHNPFPSLECFYCEIFSKGRVNSSLTRTAKESGNESEWVRIVLCLKVRPQSNKEVGYGILLHWVN